ncbi:MAG: YncE family protein [Actinomycetota bacterium]|nr:YncE family protein [Actinomycetota bacterium]
MSLQKLRLTALIVAAACLNAMTGCASDSPPEPAGAAEPGEAAELSVDPAGQVLELASNPEGIVFDSMSGLLAVTVREPNRLLLVDPATGQTQAEVPLPGHARHLQLTLEGGQVLVPSEDSNDLVQVDLPAGTTRTTAVGEYPHDATQVQSGPIVVGDEKGGTLSIVEDGQVIETVDGLTQPGGLAAVGDLVGVIDVADFTLSVYDVAAGEFVARLPAGEGPTHIAATGDTLLVADTRGDALLSFSVDPIELVSSVPLPGNPYGLAYDPVNDIAWVTLTAVNEVAGFDLSGNEPREVARYPTVMQPNTVAVDPASGRLFIAGRSSGELQIIRT